MCLPSEGTAEVNVKAVFSGRLWQYMQALEKGWGLIHLSVQAPCSSETRHLLISDA